jgi:hypothetical protein
MLHFTAIFRGFQCIGAAIYRIPWATTIYCNDNCTRESSIPYTLLWEKVVALPLEAVGAGAGSVQTKKGIKSWILGATRTSTSTISSIDAFNHRGKIRYTRILHIIKCTKHIIITDQSLMNFLNWKNHRMRQYTFLLIKSFRANFLNLKSCHIPDSFSLQNILVLLRIFSITFIILKHIINVHL